MRKSPPIPAFLAPKNFVIFDKRKNWVNAEVIPIRVNPMPMAVASRCSFSAPSKGMMSWLLESPKDQSKESMNNGAREFLTPPHRRFTGIQSWLKEMGPFVFSVRDSGRSLRMKRNVRKATMPAARKGRVKEYAASMPPNTGPNINPRARDAPIFPIACTLSPGALLSAIYARAAGRVAAVHAPWSNREKNRVMTEGAATNKKKLAHRPTKPRAITGFLPHVSESVPQKGERKSCAKAKEAARMPSMKSGIVNSLARAGRRGNTKEKEAMLRKTARYRKKKED